MTRHDPTIRWLILNEALLVTGSPVRSLNGEGWTVHLRHRDGLYQVEEVILAPHVVVPQHRHPHVDSVEHYLGGTFVLIVSGHRFEAGPQLRRLRRSVPIRATDWHGAEVGAEGARFLSIQKWDGNVPVSSVAIDWEGSEAKVVHAVHC